MRNQWLPTARTAIGWTRAELAERADVPIETLEIAENGSPLDPRFEPRIREAIRAALRAKVTPLVSRACVRVSQRRLEAILACRRATYRGSPMAAAPPARRLSRC